MGQVVDLHSRPIPLEDDEFIENLARFADGTLTEAAVKAKYHLSKEEWEALGTNDALVEKIEDVKIQRIRSGRTKRERAQNEIVDAPPILSKIMRDPNANARHVIDAVKSLDSLAVGGSSEAAAAGRVFEIRIDLGGGDVLHFSKPIDITPNQDGDDVDIDANVATPWGLVAAITAKKRITAVVAKDIFSRLNAGRLQQAREAIEQQRRHTNPISRWAQECIVADMVELDRGPYGVAMRFSLGARIATEHLYGSYVSYCRRQGVRPLTRRGFGRPCTKMFGTRRHVEDGRKRPWGYDVPIREVWQEILDGTWKRWRPLRPGEWMYSPHGPTNY